MSEIELTEISKERLFEIISDKNFKIMELYQRLDETQEKIDKAVKIINKTLQPKSDYVDYDFGSELLRQELLSVLGDDLDRFI